MEISELRTDLSKHNQSHLLQFWDQLSKEQQKLLRDDLRDIDLAKVNADFRQISSLSSSSSSSSSAGNEEALDELLEPVPEECFGSVCRTDERTLREYEDEGLKVGLFRRIDIGL